MGILDDIFGSTRRKKRARKVVKAFALWGRGSGSDEPMLIEVFKTKTAARERLSKLLKGHHWRRASDYEIRQTKIAAGRIFENRG